MSSLTISASTVKSWFQYRCDRKTRYDCMGDADRAQVPILKVVLPSRWAEFGNEFEQQLVRKLAQTQKICTPTPPDKRLTQHQSEAFIRATTPYRFAYQFVLEESLQLRNRLRIPAGVNVHRSVADLIRLDRAEDDSPLFTVIDIKATQTSTLFHRAQVAFYSLMLRGWIENLGLSAGVSDIGEIWHLKPGTASAEEGYEPEPFELRSYEHLVIDFFRNKVPAIAAQKVEPRIDKTFFHIYFKCEQCEYLDHCCKAIERPPADRDLSAVPGMSHEAKRALQRRKIFTVGDLANTPGLKAMQEMPWSVRARAERLTARATAMVQSGVQRYPNRMSYLMPPRVDDALLFVVDHNPVQGRLAALGYMKTGKEGSKCRVCVAPSGSAEEELRCLKELLGAALSDLICIDQSNCSASPTQQRYAHIFVYEPSEARNLQEAIGRHLDDPTIRTALLNMVRLFPPEETLPEPEYKGHHHLPATALRSVIEQLYAVPAVVSYDLRQVTQALAQSTPPLTQPYEPDEQLRQRFSARLSLNVAQGMQRGEIGIDRIEGDVEARLSACRELVAWLLARNAEGEPFLRLQKKPFQLHSQFNPLEPGDLDVLQAHELLQSRAGMLNTLIELALPVEERRERLRCFSGLAIKTVVDHGWWKEIVAEVPLESRDADLSSADIGLILTDDNPDIRLNPSRWPTYAVSLLPPRQHDRVEQIRIRVSKRVYAQPGFQELLNKSGSLVLDRVFLDLNAPRIMDFLAFLAS